MNTKYSKSQNLLNSNQTLFLKHVPWLHSLSYHTQFREMFLNAFILTQCVVSKQIPEQLLK